MAITISFLGIVIISTEGNLSTLEFREPVGVLLAVGSSIFWALYWIYNLKDKRDEVVKLFVNFLFGTLYVFIIALLLTDFNAIHLRGVLGSIYIGLFEMGITYLLWLKALKLSVDTAKVSNLVYISPFISLIFIRNVVGEHILVSTIVGLVFIVSGIILQQFSNRKELK